MRLLVPSVLFFVLCVGSVSFAQKEKKPRERFKPTTNDCEPREGLERGYVLDSVCSAAPGALIVWAQDYKTFDGGYLFSQYEATFVGRSGENLVKVRYKAKYETSGFVVSDDDDILELYVENPDSISVVSIGGTPELPAFELHVTLDGSNIYYKVVGDGICPSKRVKKQE